MKRRLADYALKGLLQALKDPYTAYMSAEELARIESDIKGALTGIGAHLKMIDERLTVATPSKVRRPSKQASAPGSHRGDRRQIDPWHRLAGRRPAHPWPRGIDREVENSTCRRRAGGNPVTRAAIQLSTINGFQRGPDGKCSITSDADRKIGYLHINQFGSRTAAEVRETIEALQKDGMKGLILDLRFCPGGLLDQAVEVCKLFWTKE